MDEGLLDARTYLPLALYDMSETFDSKGQIEADPKQVRILKHLNPEEHNSWK